MLRRNVLILHQAALGDFVLTWPLAAAMGRMMAQSRIIYVTHAQKGQLASCVLGVEAVDVETGWHALHGDAHMPELPAKLLAGAQAVIAFGSDGTDPLTCNLRRYCPDALIVPIPPMPKMGATGHYTEHLVQYLSPHPPLQEGLRQMLRSVATRGLGRRLATGGGLVIHPGASNPDKCWPIPNFAELARRTGQRGVRVRVILGEVELERWPTEHVAMLRAVAEVRTPCTLVELWQELASADAFLGNDSGPGHLAGIIGLPTVSLFGPSNPLVWRPIGPRVVVLHKPNIGHITIDEVEQAIQRSCLGGSSTENRRCN